MKSLRTLAVMLPLLIGAQRPPAATRPMATTQPTEQNVSASMAIDNVKLTYKGPLEVVAGQPIVISLSLRNESAKNIAYTGTGNPQSFSITIKDPDGELQATNYLFGDGVGGLKPGQSLEESYDLRHWLDMSRPGVYHIGIGRDFNGVVWFPRRELYIKDIPVHVIEESNKR